MTIALLLAAITAAAPAPSEVCAFALRKPPCEVALIDLPAVERALCVELQSAVVTATAALTITVLDAACANDATALAVHLAAGASFEPQAIALPLADVKPELRARTAALLILENVRALKEAVAASARAAQAKTAAETKPALETKSALETKPALATKPAPALATKTATSAPALSVEATARYVPRAANIIAYGARAGLQLHLLPRTELHLDAGFELATKTQPLGTIHAGAASLSAAATYALLTTAAFKIQAGARLELGYAWASGSAATAAITERSTSNLLATAGLQATASVALTETLALSATAEAARALSGIDARAGGAPAAGVAGWLARFALGATYAF